MDGILAVTTFNAKVSPERLMKLTQSSCGMEITLIPLI
jgi:hypothetical protein